MEMVWPKKTTTQWYILETIARPALTYPFKTAF